MAKKNYLAFLLYFMAFSSSSSVFLKGTRVIFSAERKEAVIQLVNSSDNLSLVQSWVDEGNIDSTPETTLAPFVVTLPVVKINPRGGAQLHIRQLANQLPTDRESIFYLNVLDIAPKPDSLKTDNILQLALRTRIKLFYRPQNISQMSQSVVEHIKISKAGGSVVIDKPTGHFFTLAAFYNPTNKNNILSKTVMLSPFSQQTVENKSHTILGNEILLEYINDECKFVNQVKKIK
ncbi:MAG: molecular chaperone [Candidatus Arsenophonus phytopathogenicus]